jgi:phosphoribosylglycinamide formyltransferase-1
VATTPRIVLLASGTGTLAKAVLDAHRAGDLPARPVALGSDRDCAALGIAAAAGLATFRVAPRDFPDRALWNRALTKAVAAFAPDLVVSAGFMRVFGEEFLAAFGDRTLNTHPALLPAFPGAHAVRDALAAGVAETGCTVHWVDAGVDTGPVIDQRRVAVRPDDDEASLHERIKARERAMLVDVLGRIAAGALSAPPAPSSRPERFRR